MLAHLDPIAIEINVASTMLQFVQRSAAYRGPSAAARHGAPDLSGSR
jgi:hypothetical protein